MRTTNRSVWLEAVCLAGMLLGSAAGCSGRSTPPAIFIGHVATLSGPDARAGKSAEQGIRLALEELGPTASEPLQGRPIVVRHVDAGGNLDSMEAAAARLVSVNRVCALLGGATKEEELRLDRSRVPVLSPTGVPAAGASEYLFTTGVAPGIQGQVLAEFLAEEAPKGGTLIVDPRRDEAQVVAEQFRRTWHDVRSKKYPNQDPPRWREISLPKELNLGDFAATITKEQRAVILFVGGPAEFALLRNHWGSTAPMLVYAGEDGSLDKLTPIAGQALYVATAFALGKDQTKVHEFAKKYKEAYREEPDVHALLGYDNLRVLVEALKKASSPTPEKVREELLKVQNFAGTTGPLSFRVDQQMRRPVFVARHEGAGRPPTAVKTYNP